MAKPNRPATARTVPPPSPPRQAEPPRREYTPAPVQETRQAQPANSEEAWWREVWDKGTKLPDMTRWTARHIFFAACCKLSYTISPTTLTTFKTKIGADVVERIQWDNGNVPYGLKVVYPNDVVIAIQGTTTRQQINTFLSSRYTKYADCYGVGMGYEEYPNPNFQRPQTSMDRRGTFGVSSYSGAIWQPFIGMVNPWISKIVEIYRSYGGRKRLWLAGHSLGGAVVDLASLWFSQARTWADDAAADQTYGSIARNVLTNLTNPEFNIEGGAVFGVPNTLCYDSYHETREYRERNSGTYYRAAGSPYDAYAKRISLINHPFDPITKVPSTTKLGDQWFEITGASGFALQQQCFPVAWRTIFGNRSFVQNNQDKIGMPKSRAHFMELVDGYHGINFYLREVFAEAVDKAGLATDVWRDFRDWVVGVESEEVLT